jgi:hypothetical protein
LPVAPEVDHFDPGHATAVAATGVEQHGARIEVETELGEFAGFIIARDNGTAAGEKPGRLLSAQMRSVNRIERRLVSRINRKAFGQIEFFRF